MPTPWFYPTTISQTAEDASHIQWDDTNNFVFLRSADNNFTKTVKSLLHIANSRSTALKNQTWYLLLTGFNFTNLPATITGLEAEIHMDRGGRITDETIQLRVGNNWIGDNQADAKLDEYKFYGSPDSNWSVDNLSSYILDPSFGMGLRFQSHPSYPHNSTPRIDYVRIRLY